eukprot:m.104013 g.104013  ORF g.104013 m.104013 type:complete len:536 (-) comp14161_c1_seq3:36-1643(-)
MSEDQRESGRIPRTIECELTADLVGSCVPGDVVTVSGEVRVAGTEDDPRRAKDQTTFLLYIFANSITNNRKTTDTEDDMDASDFTIKELYAIQRIQENEDVFRLLVQSLCPAIYGHELVKAGLCLALFGGCQRYLGDKNRVPIRGDPHVLVVGDPGLGKSQMLQAVSNVAPRGVYVCGNTTTTAGLTVTLHKDGASGDFALEAGALVLADQGCCCIDEFDKMGNQHQALLEAMEQQSISIAKAGIVCSLPARTSIIAAANPVGGHYNKAKTVSENLKMNGALLSRFDLVFILLDQADEEMDRLLSEHVMAQHGSRSARGSSALRDAASHMLSMRSENNLRDRLRIRRGEPFDPVPLPLISKYVAYARKYVHPKMTPEAAAVLQQFYLDLRKRHQRADSTPITTRQVEALVRLSEARARLALRETVSAGDAEDVVELMKCSLFDTYCDEFGQLDFQRSQLGSGMSKKAQAKRFIEELQRRAQDSYNSIFSKHDLRCIVSELGMKISSFEDFLSSLNHQGYLLKKGAQSFQLTTTDF